MSGTKLPTNANICEINDGAYYQVQLEWLPRVGDLIDLYSALDALSKHPPRHFYEVVAVMHEVHDVTEKSNPVSKGAHWVNVFVKPSSDKLFEG